MIFQWVISDLIDLIPGIDLPPGLLDSLSSLGSYASTLNYYIPLDVFLICLGVLISVSVTCAVISALMQIL